MRTEQNEITVKDAENILRAEYWNTVRRIADDVRNEVKIGNLSTTDEVTDYVHESVDGSSTVIYTRESIYCLLFSDNDSAYADELGSDGLVKDDAINWGGLAYMALRADVMDNLGDLDDLFADPLENETEGE